MFSSEKSKSLAARRRPRMSAEFGRRTTSVSAGQASSQPINRSGPVDMSKVSVRMQKRTMNSDEAISKPSAKELKDAAIAKALNAASKEPAYKVKKKSVHFGFRRILLALVCTATAVFAIVYFVNLNTPNISIKVAAMQSGIDATYPSYVPRDFNLSDITSENGKITLNFKNNASGDSFSLIEEKSSWDSNALLNNYVKNEFSEDYVTIKEQGLTIYISGNNAAWVNGGIIYKIKATSGSLTKKQIKSIAVSL